MNFKGIGIAIIISIIISTFVTFEVTSYLIRNSSDYQNIPRGPQGIPGTSGIQQNQGVNNTTSEQLSEFDEEVLYIRLRFSDQNISYGTIDQYRKEYSFENFTYQYMSKLKINEYLSENSNPSALGQGQTYPYRSSLQFVIDFKNEVVAVWKPRRQLSRTDTQRILYYWSPNGPIS
jgi:hypothetical protein